MQHAPVMFVAGLDLPQHAKNPSDNALPGVNGHAIMGGQETSTQEPRDPFIILAARLRNALGARRRSAIWDADKSHRFNVLLVDKVGSDYCVLLMYVTPQLPPLFLRRCDSLPARLFHNCEVLDWTIITHLLQDPSVLPSLPSLRPPHYTRMA